MKHNRSEVAGQDIFIKMTPPVYNAVRFNYLQHETWMIYHLAGDLRDGYDCEK